jgi:hypothetical protein
VQVALVTAGEDVEPVLLRCLGADLSYLADSETMLALVDVPSAAAGAFNDRARNAMQQLYRLAVERGVHIVQVRVIGTLRAEFRGGVVSVSSLRRALPATDVSRRTPCIVAFTVTTY